MYKYTDKLDVKLSNKLLSMGLHISNVGFKYIMDAIKIYHEVDGHIMVGEIYKRVAEINKSTVSRVERGIRAEVTRYYDKHYGFDLPEELIGDADRGKLANHEFIMRITHMFHYMGIFDTEEQVLT